MKHAHYMQKKHKRKRLRSSQDLNLDLLNSSQIFLLLNIDVPAWLKSNNISATHHYSPHYKKSTKHICVVVAKWHKM